MTSLRYKALMLETGDMRNKNNLKEYS
jgi:hypothetical protein